MYFVGIDWADLHHDVAVLDEKGQELKYFTVPHKREGMEQLKQKLLSIDPDPESFACMVETKNGLLVQFLLEAGFPVYPLNPKVVDYRRKPSGAKSDPIDARLLANIGRSDLAQLKRLKPDAELIAELKMLTRDQDGLIQESTRLTNKLIACLKEYYPVALGFFSKPTLPVALEFYKCYPTLELVRKATVPEIAAFLKKHRHPRPNQTAISIWQKAHEPQLCARTPTVRAKCRLMLALVGQLEVVRKQIDAYDEEINRLFQLHSDSRIFASLPGAAGRLAPRLLAEWSDDRERYEDAAVVQALAGTSPVLFQSGKYRFARQRKSCVKPFRRAMHLFAFQSISQVPWAREYYDTKRSQGKTHHEALRALANIWVRVIFAMWKNRTCYDEATFIAARARHLNWAA
ncbi:transposase and inactivated derivatives [Pelotomaculum thermopropionicum SI]|uniref:Transposase and inactivated derivatives n=1 Tax=Pelotomaculum thermopropionicum (strain DSM 13744 / JCM 10971 / SI) TaxID=370438 RepID=A5CZL4_PELTS|nr:transposase and inactivated derivatives [Pelotomaculum thermopropionicum SI]